MSAWTTLPCPDAHPGQSCAEYEIRLSRRETESEEYMADWTLVPCLVQLRAAFDRLAPDRDHSSDGSVGDRAHASRASDHNPAADGQVHAIDVDMSGPWPGGLTMERIVQHLLARCRSGAEKRLTYVIYNRRIWSASSGWVQKPYSGANRHDKHAHFSASHNPQLEASTASWHLEDLMALTDAEITKLAAATWAHKIASPALGVQPKPAGDWLKDAEQVSREVATLGKSLLAAITALASKDQVDEVALAAALAPAVAALIIPALPDDPTVTVEQLQQAILGALREFAAPQVA
jgi:hypothetical protein